MNAVQANKQRRDEWDLPNDPANSTGRSPRQKVVTCSWPTNRKRYAQIRGVARKRRPDDRIRKIYKKLAILIAASLSVEYLVSACHNPHIPESGVKATATTDSPGSASGGAGGAVTRFEINQTS